MFEKFDKILLSVNDEKLGDKTHLFILTPINFLIFLFILLISNGIFPRLLPRVNLNDGISADKKDEYNIDISNNKINLTKKIYSIIRNLIQHNLL